MENEDKTFQVNYDKVTTEKGLLSLTRMLAVELSHTPYKSVGEFFTEMTDGDLQLLVTIIDEGEKHPNFEDLILIAGMLAGAEGLENGSLEEYHKRTNQLTSFIICESLGRKGLVKVYRENMSLGEDMKDAIIVEKLDE